MSCLIHHINLVSFILSRLFVAHYAFSFGEKNSELYQLAVFSRKLDLFIRICAFLLRVYETAVMPKSKKSADFQSGLNAYEKGDYKKALRKLSPLAEQGHSKAQNRLGVMYLNP